MKVNTELKKDVQRFLQPSKESTGVRRHTAYKFVPENTCRKDLDNVLKGAEDVPRRVIRAIANIAQRPVSAYLGGE